MCHEEACHVAEDAVRAALAAATVIGAASIATDAMARGGGEANTVAEAISGDLAAIRSVIGIVPNALSIGQRTTGSSAAVAAIHYPGHLYAPGGGIVDEARNQPSSARPNEQRDINY